MSYLSIPAERVGALVGTNGTTKKEIEDKTGSKISVTHGGEVTIDCKDSLNEIKSTNIVKAIGRGFSPKRALKLLDDDYTFEVVDLQGNERQLARIRARLIGTKGKARKLIEERFNCGLSIYGDTVSIIATFDSIGNVIEALEMLIRGSEHGSMYKFIEKTA